MKLQALGSTEYSLPHVENVVMLNDNIVNKLYDLCLEIDKEYTTNCGPQALQWNLFWIIQHHLEKINHELQQK